ncbi:MAG: hypothetical protein DBX52_05235 [Clostridiales bacterium]|nr:MAG: hypothetical protein DBX52_05235 [Clostridiales bacterium]
MQFAWRNVSPVAADCTFFIERQGNALKEREAAPAVIKKPEHEAERLSCIYLAEGCRCKILRVQKCLGGACTFCRDERAEQESKRRWLQRMNNINPDNQAKIAGTYFGGRMPWKE